MKRLIATLFLLLPTLCFGQGFGSFLKDQPFLAYSSTEIDPCSMPDFPFDGMDDYTESDLVNLLNGGCNWDGAYVAGTYSNLVNMLWYADAADEYSTDFSTSYGTNLLGGTNWIWTVTREIVTITEQGWTNAYAIEEYTNSYNTLLYADAMDEYTDTAGVTNLVGGTNWVFLFYATNTMAQDLVSTEGWTNVYAAKDY